MVVQLRNPVRFLVALPCLFCAAGCASDSALLKAADARIETSETPKENTVQFVSFVHQVHFAAGSTGFAPGEANALDGFITRLAPHYADRVQIDSGAVSGNANADALAARRAEAVAAELRRMGAATVEIEQAGDNVDANAVAVGVSRYVATGPKCPDWNDKDPQGFSNTPTSNFGCATITNLGAMVANPADLLRGAQPGPADAEFVARGVQRYRNGEISKSLEPELSQGSAMSGSMGGGAK